MTKPDSGSRARTTWSALRAARETAGLSIPELARRAGLRSPAIGDWERRGVCPRRSTMEAVSEVLSTDPATLDPACWDRRTAGRRGDECAGRSLQRLRLAAGLSLREVSQAIGVTVASISHWENGRAWPSHRYWRQLAEVYGVDEIPLPSKIAVRAEVASLAALRARRGLRMHDVARKVGIPVINLRLWEKGRLRPDPESLKRLADLYGVPVRVIAVPAAPFGPKQPKIHGARLRELRLARGWTQEALARRIGISWNTVARWEIQPRAPQAKTWAKLAAALDVPVDDLVLDPTANASASRRDN